MQQVQTCSWETVLKATLWHTENHCLKWKQTRQVEWRALKPPMWHTQVSIKCQIQHVSLSSITASCRESDVSSVTAHMSKAPGSAEHKTTSQEEEHWFSWHRRNTPAAAAPSHIYMYTAFRIKCLIPTLSFAPPSSFSHPSPPVSFSSLLPSLILSSPCDDYKGDDSCYESQTDIWRFQPTYLSLFPLLSLYPSLFFLLPLYSLYSIFFLFSKFQSAAWRILLNPKNKREY